MFFYDLPKASTVGILLRLNESLHRIFFTTYLKPPPYSFTTYRKPPPYSCTTYRKPPSQGWKCVPWRNPGRSPTSSCWSLQDNNRCYTAGFAKASDIHQRFLGLSDSDLVNSFQITFRSFSLFCHKRLYSDTWSNFHIEVASFGVNTETNNLP